MVHKKPVFRVGQSNFKISQSRWKAAEVEMIFPEFGKVGHFTVVRNWGWVRSIASRTAPQRTRKTPAHNRQCDSRRQQNRGKAEVVYDIPGGGHAQRLPGE